MSGWQIKTGNYKDRYETCICCHKRVDISIDQDIEFRPFYVEGAGQLCYDCYQELYVDKGHERLIRDVIQRRG